MTAERSELSLAFARVLFVNGQATDQIVASIRRLTSKFGLKADHVLRPAASLSPRSWRIARRVFSRTPRWR